MTAAKKPTRKPPVKKPTAKPKAAPKRVEPVLVDINVADPEERGMLIATRYGQAKQELAAHKAWAAGGGKGVAPSTPNLDAIRVESEYKQSNGGKRMASTKQSEAGGSRVQMTDADLKKVVAEVSAKLGPDAKPSAVVKAVRAAGHSAGRGRIVAQLGSVERPAAKKAAASKKTASKSASKSTPANLVKSGATPAKKASPKKAAKKAPAKRAASAA